MSVSIYLSLPYNICIYRLFERLYKIHGAREAMILLLVEGMKYWDWTLMLESIRKMLLKFQRLAERGFYSGVCSSVGLQAKP